MPQKQCPRPVSCCTQIVASKKLTEEIEEEIEIPDPTPEEIAEALAKKDECVMLLAVCLQQVLSFHAAKPKVEVAQVALPEGVLR